MAGGLVDEDSSQSRVSSELECAAAHRGLVGNRHRQSDGLIYVVEIGSGVVLRAI